MGAVDRDRILQMRGEGQSLRQFAENSGVGYGTVRESLKGGERKTPRNRHQLTYKGYLAATALPKIVVLRTGTPPQDLRVKRVRR
jgi:hypothetical protein